MNDSYALWRELIKFNDFVECVVIERLSRFAVKVIVGGAENIAYLNNTGRLRGYIVEGRKGICVSYSGGKYGYRLIGVEDMGLVTIIDTKLHERSFEVLLSENLIPWLKDCRIVRRGVKVCENMIDYLIQCKDRKAFVEIKSAVANLGEGLSGYPDAPTERGRRQIDVLADIAKDGEEAFVVFVVGLPRAKGFRLLCEEDKKICNAVRKALSVGVKFKAVNIFLDPKTKSIVLGDTDLPVDLSCCMS